MKTLLAAILMISVGIASAYAGGFMLLHVGVADGSGVPPSPCDQTGLDFTVNCNIILIPALIH